MTRSALARAAGLSSSSAVRMIETGQRAVTLDVLGRLALALNTTVATLFDVGVPTNNGSTRRDRAGRPV